MKEYTYQLEKEDYREWIQWNIKKHDQKKTRYITAGVLLALLALTLGGNLSSGKPLPAVLGSVVMFLGLGVLMFYFISPQNQERMIWKKSGLKKMEKTGFPRVNLVLRDDGFDLYGPNRDETQIHYQYTSLAEIVELERLFLLKTADGGYQFVSKKAFADSGERQEFLDLLNEKIKDAKENPEKYKKEEPASGGGEEDDRPAVWEEGYVVRNKNTANMGKIGQMAHILAPSGGEEADGCADAKGRENGASERETVKEKAETQEEKEGTEPGLTEAGQEEKEKTAAGALDTKEESGTLEGGDAEASCPGKE